MNLTKGNISSSLIVFTLPMVAGALLQQCYNIADTLIVGRLIGSDALAAVGSAYTIMVFITSVVTGLTMGGGTLAAIRHGAGQTPQLRKCVASSAVITAAAAIILTALSFTCLDWTLRLMQVPADIRPIMSCYLSTVFWGIILISIYNFCASMLRAIGDSSTPLWFLAAAVILNILLDLLFILHLGMGINGAAIATVIAQAAAAIGIAVFTIARHPHLRISAGTLRQLRWRDLRYVTSFSILTSTQQSIMNFGILMVQGLVNSFGTAVMAAFAAGVKIDSLAYMPAQEFGNAFSTFVAQNHGAGKQHRIVRGLNRAIIITTIFSATVALAVCLFARPLICLFVDSAETDIINHGIRYLRIEGPFYFGIGILFLWYGYYRAVRLPAMSVVLTIISLGLRVALAYLLSAIPSIGVAGIWWAIPIGWILADTVALAYYRLHRVTKKEPISGWRTWAEKVIE